MVYRPSRVARLVGQRGVAWSVRTICTGQDEISRSVVVIKLIAWDELVDGWQVNLAGWRRWLGCANAALPGNPCIRGKAVPGWWGPAVLSFGELCIGAG